MRNFTETFLFDEGFILMLFIYGGIATAIGHPFVGLGIAALVAFPLFLTVYIGERRDD